MKEIFILILGKPFGIVIYQLLEATQFTIYLSLVAFIGGGIAGGIITLLRIFPNNFCRRFAISYIWLFQSIPLLMILFLSGLGVPRFFEIEVDPWTSASFSLTLFTSAYLADVWRGAIESVSDSQWEAGFSLGLGFFQILRKIILPQSYQVALAPTVGFMVQIVKGSSLAYIIGFQDLMLIGKRWANSSISGTEPFVVFPIMAMVYFMICFPLSMIAQKIENRMGNIRKNPLTTAA